MSRRRDDDGFAGAIPGVRRLDDRDKLRPEPPPDVEASGASSQPPRFVVEEQDGLVFARREDVSRRQLTLLRTGRTRVDREIDLHGRLAREAEPALLLFLEQARREGCRCVLVIHGAGRHSEGGPVLRTALPAWLLEGRLAGEILAFASAPRHLGGRGASLVLLRRAR